GKNGAVKVWDARTGQEKLSLGGHKGKIDCVAYSPDGTCLASLAMGYDAGKRKMVGEVKVWDAHTGKELYSREAPGGLPVVVAFSPDGGRIISSAGLDNALLYWEARTGKPLPPLKVDREGLAVSPFSPDGKRIVCLGDRGALRVRDAQTGKLLLAIPAD